MADDPTPTPTEPDAPELGDAGKQALSIERRARREAERQAADLQARLDELENAGKSETERLTSENAALKAQAADSTSKLLRLEVAVAKGLTPAQAKRLVGSSQEELEADADDLLATFKPAVDPAADTKVPPTQRPVTALAGGADPTEEPDELDPRKLAAGIARP